MLNLGIEYSVAHRMIINLQSIPEVLPLYHPTRILLVDEDNGFLERLSTRLRARFQCVCFSTAQQAIEYLRSETVHTGDLLPNADQQDADAMEHIADRGQRILQGQLSRLTRVFANESRFGATSVIVTNHTLPDMSGVAMLHALREVPLCKILLTEAHDMQSAADTCAEGLIDAFIPKQHQALPDALADHLQTSQFAFFRELTSLFEPALTSPDTSFLSTASFREQFRRFVNDYQIIEYCVLLDPPGILGLDEAGSPTILLVIDEDFQQASFEIAQAELAPVELLGRLLDGRSVAVFPTSHGFYAPNMERRWRQYVWPGLPLGDGCLRCAVIDEPDVIRRVCGTVASYADYRNRRLS